MMTEPKTMATGLSLCVFLCLGVYVWALPRTVLFVSCTTTRRRLMSNVVSVVSLSLSLSLSVSLSDACCVFRSLLWLESLPRASWCVSAMNADLFGYGQSARRARKPRSKQQSRSAPIWTSDLRCVLVSHQNQELRIVQLNPFCCRMELIFAHHACRYNLLSGRTLSTTKRRINITVLTFGRLIVLTLRSWSSS